MISMKLHASGEDYLKAILILKKQNGDVRCVELAQYMGYTLPSISRAVTLLKEGNYLEKDQKGYLCLTERGRIIAEEIFARYQFLTHVLMKLGVSKEIAEHDACQIEHVISEESLQRLREIDQESTELFHV